ncbi:hypothetical protein N8600_05895 [Gammaproteobacteria bacterium]|nr:hypothetical protein [Gammaproteobacteria bacterium]
MYKGLIKGLSVIIGVFFLSAAALAQEGHPLKGSWIGEWSGNTTHGDFVLIVMDWNGEEVTGMINPGTDNMEIESVELDTSDWSVVISADGYTIDATIENLELPSRALSGSWRSSNGRGDFEIVRQ